MANTSDCLHGMIDLLIIRRVSIILVGNVFLITYFFIPFSVLPKILINVFYLSFIRQRIRIGKK